MPQSLIRFIGISEVLGAVRVVIPWLSNIMLALTPLAATGLGVIMVLAARVHYRRGETRTVFFNVLILLVCIFVTYGRSKGLS